ASSLRNEFEAKGVDTVNFAKKLLGQIIFLYFLQKKGWFGVGRDDDWDTGSKHFLRELFKKKHGDYNNFFNDILEPLFYDALRNDRSHDDGYYSRFNCKIPFLNGGLFDPIGNYDWVHTDILLPNKLFSNQTKTKEGDTGTGILDVFDRYNFTVKEDEPLEKEVAIDPELLGKSYEKFNAIRPDNFAEFKKALKSDRKGEENKFNKKFGVYYTPREIVHYMCQQSLINYLDTAVNTHKQSITTKPSVQKKIFGPQSPVQQTLTSDSYKPIISKENIETLIQIGEQFSENEARVLSKGKETKTYSHQLPESIRKKAKLIDDKLAEITVCDPAVGSGAFPVGMMSEIVKARNVLSVFLNDKGRTAYAFKRQCIEHSLYGVDIDPGAVEIAKLRLWLSLVVDEDDIKNIKPLPNLDYKIVCGNSLLGVEKNLFNYKLFNELEKLKPLFFNETNPTKKQEYKKQIDKLISEITSGHKEFDFEVYFSEVFHNKGGFDVVIANPPYGANIDRYTKKFEEKYPETTKSFKDIYKIFYELGLSKLVVLNGTLSFITPNTFLTQPRYKDLRKYLLKHTIQRIINLGENVFQAVVTTAVTIVAKTEPLSNSEFSFADLSVNSKYSGEIENISFASITQQTYINNYDYIFTAKSRGFLNTVPLDDMLAFKDAGINYQRVKVGLGEKGKSDLGKRLLYEGEKENTEDMKYWKGTDIDEYYIKPLTRRFVRMSTIRNLKNNERVILNAEYFSIIPKLIWRQTAQYPIAAVDKRGIWFGRSIQAATVKNTFKDKIALDYLAGLLNSKFMRWLYVQNVKETGRVFPQVKLANLRVLPIKLSDQETQNEIGKIVYRIERLTQSESYHGNKLDYKELKNKIDQLVYKLYDLTREEIKIVEGGLIDNS
ncbi:MAG: N-6 DNA methylase, partial [Patescibacteria group bacterium]|nr:N-6 DNA methylase [Patescibacteria group bacterium]